jgi:hypothetical protein
VIARKPNPAYVPIELRQQQRPAPIPLRLRVISRPPTDQELLVMEKVCLACRAFSGSFQGSVVGCRECPSCSKTPVDHRRMDLGVHACPRGKHAPALAEWRRQLEGNQ